MKRKRLIYIAVIMMFVFCIAGCEKKDVAEDKSEVAQETTETAATEVAESEATDAGATDSETTAPIPDGIYTVDVDTDSTMFHLNETSDGKGTLTVKDGQMTLHITLAAKGIVNAFPGTAEEAKADGAVWIEHTLDEVTYSDGATDEAFGFDIPTPYLDEPFPCAIVGTKGRWYDHEVTVSNPVPVE